MDHENRKFLMKPEEPSDEDCCHNGCDPCVFDIYERKLKNWSENRIGNLQEDLLSETSYKTFRFTSVQKITEDTSLYFFQAYKNGARDGFLDIKPGQHLVVKIDKNARPYTVVYNKENCTFGVIIKLYTDGLGSDYFRKLKIDDFTYWRGPYGEFSYSVNKYKKITMISMGTGLAPLFSISNHILKNEDDETIIYFLHSCKSSSDIILRKELNEMSSFWNFHCSFYLTQKCDVENKKHCEKFIGGRINEDHLKEYFQKEVIFLVCGSEQFSNTIKELLIKNGVFNMFIF